MTEDQTKFVKSIVDKFSTIIRYSNKGWVIDTSDNLKSDNRARDSLQQFLSLKASELDKDEGYFLFSQKTAALDAILAELKNRYTENKKIKYVEGDYEKEYDTLLRESEIYATNEDLKNAEFKIIHPTKGLVECPLDVFLARTQRRKDELISYCPVVSVRFDCTKTDKLFVEQEYARGELVEVKYINLYDPPYWHYKKNDNTELPEIFEDFFNILFPQERDRLYVFHWLHWLTRGRNETILCLIGAKGTGKGMFMELAKTVSGRKNSKVEKQGFFRSEFNGSLDQARLICFDEVNLSTSEDIEVCKAITNKEVAITKKGVDTKTAPNYSSFILASNKSSNFTFSPDDRRFSVPRLSDTNLREFWNESKRDYVAKLFCDELDPLIIDFCSFIYNLPETKYFDKSFSNTKEFAEEYFYKIYENSKSTWQSILCQKIDSELTTNIKVNRNFAKVSMNELRDVFEENKLSRTPKVTTVSTFVAADKVYDPTTRDSVFRFKPIKDIPDILEVVFEASDEYVELFKKKYGSSIKSYNTSNEIDVKEIADNILDMAEKGEGGL